METTPIASEQAAFESLQKGRARLETELGKVIVGQRDVVEQLLLALIAGGHCLITGAPGLAKTLLVKTIASAFQLQFQRIQFTPDLMPADITGTEILTETDEGRKLTFVKGPIFGNMILADEINRTPPKTQAALLEAMQEHQVTAAGVRHALSEPFFVLATQNPVEMEGTYPLPEAQLDRFLFNVLIDYLPENDEVAVVQQTTSRAAQAVQGVFSGEDVLQISGTRAPRAGGGGRGALRREARREFAPENAGRAGLCEELDQLGRGHARGAGARHRREGPRALARRDARHRRRHPRTGRAGVPPPPAPKLPRRGRRRLRRAGHPETRGGAAEVGVRTLRIAQAASPTLTINPSLTNSQSHPPCALSSPQGIDPQALFAIKDLELRARVVVEGLWSGLHRSPYAGFSVEFTEYRQYSPGDDLRYLDWKLLARSDRHYIKKFEDETNLRCLILVDTSRSMLFGSKGWSKAAYARTLAATFAYFLGQQRDVVGLALFDRKVHEYLPPRWKPGHIRHMMALLEREPEGRESRLSDALDEVAQAQPQAQPRAAPVRFSRAGRRMGAGARAPRRRRGTTCARCKSSTPRR